MPIEALGIVAGEGILPYLAYQEAKKKGIPTYFFAVEEENPYLKDIPSSNIEKVSVTQVGKFFQKLHKKGISHVVFLGKIQKKHLFSSLKFDLTTLKLLKKAPNFNDNTLFWTLCEELEKRGIKVLPQGKFLPSLLLKEGIYTRKKPRKKDWEDIYFGLYYAKKIGELDIGQTVVVKKKSVLAVEAIEGTNACIIRGGKLGKEGVVVCKAEKKNQDPRFDIPTVGLSTLDAMKEVKAKILAIEAEKTFVVTPQEMIQKANKLGIILVAAKVPKKL